MIKVANLKKSFNGQEVLRDISLSIDPGEVVVILGESGSGKSVFLQHLIGLFKPDSGSIVINGIDITTLPERQLLKLRKNMGYLFQEGALYDFMTVFENVAFPLREHTNLRRREIREKVLHILKQVGLEESGGKLPSELSGGMRKRAALARSVVLDSKILFCDEPTSGLDPKKSKEISDLINDLSHRLECTTVIASHDMYNSFRIADRLVLINQGQIIAKGKPEEIELSTDPKVKEFLI